MNDPHIPALLDLRQPARPQHLCDLLALIVVDPATEGGDGKRPHE
jgi:hypothetical protein